MDDTVVVSLLAPVDDARPLGILIKVEEEVMTNQFHLIESLSQGQGDGLEDLLLDIEGAVPGDFHVTRDLPRGQDIGCLVGALLGQNIQDLGNTQPTAAATTIRSLD